MWCDNDNGGGGSSGPVCNTPSRFLAESSLDLKMLIEAYILDQGLNSYQHENTKLPRGV